MALDLGGFKKRFPEFGDVSSTVFDCALAEALNFVSVRQFGCKADDALGYYMAHLFECGVYQAGDGCTSGQSSPGPVSSVRVGNVATSFAVKADDGELGATKYGRRFITIRKTIFPSRFSGRVSYGCGCC